MGMCGKKKCKGSITNVLNNFEHESHTPSSAQVKVTRAMSNT